MPSSRSILLVGLPLAASSFAQIEPSRNDHVVVLDTRTAGPEQRHSIVEYGRDAIERVVESAREELGFKKHLRKRQDLNTTLPVTVSDVLTTTVSLPIGDTTTSSSSQGQSTTSSILASSSAAQDPVSTETPVSVSTTLSSVPVTTEQPPATSSEGQTPPTTIVPSTSLPVAGTSSVIGSQELGSSSSAAPPSSSSSSSIDEAPSTTTSVVGPTAEPTSNLTSDPTSAPTSTPSSEAVPSTTSAVQPSETTLAAIDSAGSVVTSVPSVATVSNGNGAQVTLTSPTPGGVYTDTQTNGNVVIVTYTPDGGTVSEIRFITTTLPNGSATIRTSYATVGAPSSPTGDSANSDGAAGENAPQLQSGAAVPSSWYAAEVAVILGAAVGAAAILL